MTELLNAAGVWAPGSLVMLGLLAGSGMLAAVEAALFSLPDDQLRMMRVGTRRERLAARLLADRESTEVGGRFARLVLELSYDAVGIGIGIALTDRGLPLWGILFAVAAFLLSASLGDALPRAAGAAKPYRVASALAPLFAGWLWLMGPLIPRLQQAARIGRRAFWPHVTREPLPDSAELRRVVEAEGTREALRDDWLVLRNVLNLSELTAEEAMRPRGTFLVLPPPIRLGQLRGEVPPGDLILVQDEKADDVRGAIPLAEFALLPEGGLESHAQDVAFVPWCARGANVLQLLRDRHVGVACVVNEYGESVGIVTQDDLLDAVLSSDPSRVRRLLDREPVQDVGPDEWQVEGMTTLRYLSRRIGLEFDPDADPVVTVAGLLNHELEQMAKPGESIEWRGFRFEVANVAGRGAMRVRVKREAAP